MVIKTPKDAELNAAEAMRSWGYLDASSPLHSADGGIDVRSSKALAQVKFRSVKAGRPEIQNLYGARAADMDKSLMFFDYKGYSPQAIEYANKMGVGLYVYDTSGAVLAVNMAGKRLMAVSTKIKLLTLLTTSEIKIAGLILLGLILSGLLIALTII